MMRLAVEQWLAYGVPACRRSSEPGGYEGKHWKLPPYRLGSEFYVPSHAKPEVAAS